MMEKLVSVVKTNVKNGSTFYEPFVISSISSSRLALRLFLPGT